MKYVDIYQGHHSSSSVMVLLWMAGNYLAFRELVRFVLFGWRFVFGIIMRWEGRWADGKGVEHSPSCCHRDPGIYKAVFLLLLSYAKKVTPRTWFLVSPARGYFASPHSHLTKRRRRQDWLCFPPPWPAVQETRILHCKKRRSDQAYILHTVSYTHLTLPTIYSV